MVGAIVANKNNLEDMTVSHHGWWDRFRKRHPHLSLRSGEALPGFKKAGVFPLNHKAITIPGESNTPTAALARREGICSMPF